MEAMSAPVPPALSRRDERRRRSRRRTIATVAIAAGSVLVLVAVAAVVWIGFAPPRHSDHVVAITSPTATPIVTPTPTPTQLTREQMALTPPMGWNSWND